MPRPEMFASNMGIEILYSVIIISVCLIIYFSTKEIYKLTSHKGVKYFRNTFLFFAIAYSFRFLARPFAFMLQLFETIKISPLLSRTVILIVFVYASTMALFYLIYSILWKKLDKTILSKNYLLHLAALILAIIAVFVKPELFLLFQLVAIIFTSVIVYLDYNKSKEKKIPYPLYIIYALLIIFWIFNILSTIIPNFFRTTQTLLYLISTVLFLIIFYKVITKIKK